VKTRTAAHTLYLAVSGGGIWKSIDAGKTFTAAWPVDQTQTMGAVALGSDGTLWAGTGEANPSGGGLTFFGDGVYRSTDGGAHWRQWGLTESGAIGKIVVDPRDPRRVFVAAAGNLSGTAAERGIYRLSGLEAAGERHRHPPGGPDGHRPEERREPRANRYRGHPQ
jgi:hypothetical protein